VVTRAVYLEVAGDLIVEAFLRRFSSRKSLQRKMVSDTASTYLVAVEAMQSYNLERSIGTSECHMGVHTQMIPTVWGFLGMHDWFY